MTFGSLFSGIGGLDLALEAFGHTPVWQAECDPHARAVLRHHWPAVRCFEDVREIDAQAPPPEIICGGFPCQDISLAGAGAGIDGPKSGLWSEFARIVRVLRPGIVFVENVAALLGRGLDRVLGDLAALGFNAEWETFLASDVGAPHRRDRLFLLAYSDRERVRQLAERDQRGGWGERAAERGDAEPVHDRAPLAEPDSGGRDARSRATARNEERAELGDGDNSTGLFPDAGGARCEGVRIGEPSRARRADPAELRAVALAHPHGELLNERQRQSRRRALRGAVIDGDGQGDTGPMADAVRSGQRTGEWDLRAGQPDVNGWGEGVSMADGHREGRGRIRGLSDGDDEARGDADRRHRSHRFPPGPAAIAGWDGPQPAVRRGDDGVPGRSHRLRLLGNAVVWQQAALALETLTERALQSSARAA